ncbi:hypothetical protein Tco_1226380 [Tanacetum coccineum]
MASAQFSAILIDIQLNRHEAIYPTVRDERSHVDGMLYSGTTLARINDSLSEKESEGVEMLYQIHMMKRSWRVSQQLGLAIAAHETEQSLIVPTSTSSRIVTIEECLPTERVHQTNSWNPIGYTRLSTLSVIEHSLVTVKATNALLSGCTRTLMEISCQRKSIR